MTDIPGKEEIIKKVKQLATPIDFEQLGKDKIIEKNVDWYKILDSARLPEYALSQVIEFRSDSKGNLHVKFPKSWKKAQESYRKMTGKEHNE